MPPTDIYHHALNLIIGLIACLTAAVVCAWHIEVYTGRAILSLLAFLVCGGLGILIWQLSRHARRAHAARYETLKQQLLRQIEDAGQIAQQAITSQAERDQIYETSSEGFLVVSKNYDILRINPALISLLRLQTDSAQCRGRKCHEVIPNQFCHTRNCPKCLMAELHPANTREIDIALPDGGRRPMIVSASPFKDLKGDVMGIVVSFRDLTDHRQALAFEQEKLAAQAASRAKGDFLAHMSHEIRTPLSGIIGMTEIALATRLDDNQRRILGIIERESNHLLDLINDILDFSKIEAGKLSLETVAFDLHRLLQAVSESTALQANQKGLEINVFCSPAVPRRMMGDPTRLRQVLLNLAANAVKFTAEGEINIHVEWVARQSEALRLRFDISDTGIGISADQQSTIFESFAQADTSITRRYGGTGLGTTISKSLVELMGGRLILESIPGRGTSVSFELSFEPAADESQPQPEPKAAWDHLRVLIVDDCFTSRKYALKYLDALGCRPIEAQNGPQALELLKAAAAEGEPFELIITDFHMPQMSGYELVQQLRRLESYQQVPVMAVTGLQEIATGEDFRSLGFDRCLAKPITLDGLKEAIDRVYRPATAEKHIHAEASCATKKARILVVEDYQANQQVAAMHLNSAGYAVDLAENGRQAVERFSPGTYDLILMDLEMPVMDGYAATRAIRQSEQQHNTRQPDRPGTTVPIIALTAHALKGHEEKSRQAGMNDFLTKPLRRKKLLATIQRWLVPPAKGTGDETSGDAAPGEPPGVHSVPLNWDQALEEFMGQEAVLRNVLIQFQETVTGQLVAITRALADQDGETVRKQAHAIKGGAANLTADPLSRIASRLEEIGASGRLAEGRQVLEELSAEFARLGLYLAANSINSKCSL